MADEKKRDDDFVIDMGDRKGRFDSPPRRQSPPAAAPLAAATNNPIFPVLSYCGSSILMTVTNKYVLSGTGFNLNFLLLCVQVSDDGTTSHARKLNPFPVVSMRYRNPNMQIIGSHYIQRLQQGRG